MRPPIFQRQLSSKLVLSVCHPTLEHKGKYWLYDKTRGMNLAMGRATEEAALVHALEYYQERLASVEAELKDLKEKVETFVVQVCPPDREEEY